MLKKMLNLLLVSSLVVSTGCARYLDGKDFESWDNVKRLSNDLTESSIKEKVFIKKIGLVGFSTGSINNGIGGTTDLVKQNELNKAFAQANNILKELNFEVVPTKVISEDPVYNSIGSKEVAWGWLNASDTRLLMVGGWGIYVDKTSDEDLGKLIDSLKVDAVLLMNATIFTTTNIPLIQQGTNHPQLVYMALYSKDKQNPQKARLIWQGSVKNKSYGYDLKNEKSERPLSEIIISTFKLMTARMINDLK